MKEKVIAFIIAGIAKVFPKQCYFVVTARGEFYLKLFYWRIFWGAMSHDELVAFQNSAKDWVGSKGTC